MDGNKIFIEKEIPGSEWVALYDIVSRSDTIGAIRKFFEEESKRKEPLTRKQLEIGILKIISDMPYLYIDTDKIKGGELN